jgi:hypothetical protein
MRISEIEAQRDAEAIEGLRSCFYLWWEAPFQPIAVTASEYL